MDANTFNCHNYQTKYAASCAILSFGLGLPRPLPLPLPPRPLPRPPPGLLRRMMAWCFSTRLLKIESQNTQPECFVSLSGNGVLSCVQQNQLSVEFYILHKNKNKKSSIS